MFGSIKIKKNVRELKQDILSTTDPLKQAILVEFLRIKIMEAKNKVNVVDKIIKEQNTSIDKLKQYDKLTDKSTDKYRNIAYDELVSENSVVKVDPKYEKCIIGDYMNNKLMERLQSEVDVVSGNCEDVVAKPFDDLEEEDITNIHAHWGSV